jgi:hypothetical protein
MIVGNTLRDANGKSFVARGPEIVIDDPTRIADIDQIAADGANAVRLLLDLDAYLGLTPQDFDSILAEVQAKNMVAWISLVSWDGSTNYALSPALGGGNFYNNAAPPNTGTCVLTGTDVQHQPTYCYLAIWNRQWLMDLMAKYKQNVIIDGMQEFIGFSESDETDRVAWRDSSLINLQFFRSVGYTNPLEFMSASQGRDLYAITEFSSAIGAGDSNVVNGSPQVMFGWQAYWSDPWYPSWQGGLFGVGTITGAQAIATVVPTIHFPVEIGIEMNDQDDTAVDYTNEINAAASINPQGMGNWLFWAWQNGTNSVQCDTTDPNCSVFVETNQNGFAGASAF